LGEVIRVLVVLREGESERSKEGSSVQSSVGVWMPAGGGGRRMGGILRAMSGYRAYGI
jgi:hypothetical protein